MSERLGGLILAGGRSSRLGREKAVALWRGEPLIAHVARCFVDCDDVAVSARSGSGAAAWAAERGWAVLSDPADAPDGPLSGIREGLRWARLGRCDALAVAPCDSPALPRDVFAQLTARLAGESAGAVCETAQGLEPLIAVWRVEPTLRILEDLMVEGAHPPVRALVKAANAEALRFEADASFLNLNEPHDFNGAGGHERIR